MGTICVSVEDRSLVDYLPSLMSVVACVAYGLDVHFGLFSTVCYPSWFGDAVYSVESYLVEHFVSVVAVGPVYSYNVDGPVTVNVSTLFMLWCGSSSTDFSHEAKVDPDCSLGTALCPVCKRNAGATVSRHLASGDVCYVGTAVDSMVSYL